MAEKESAKETVLQVIFFIRGYHEYQEICTLEIDDEYELEREPLNSQRRRWEGLRLKHASTRMN